MVAWSGQIGGPVLDSVEFSGRTRYFHENSHGLLDKETRVGESWRRPFFLNIFWKQNGGNFARDRGVPVDGVSD